MKLTLFAITTALPFCLSTKEKSISEDDSSSSSYKLIGNGSCWNTDQSPYDVVGFDHAETLEEWDPTLMEQFLLPCGEKHEDVGEENTVEGPTDEFMRKIRFNKERDWMNPIALMVRVFLFLLGLTHHFGKHCEKHQQVCHTEMGEGQWLPQWQTKDSRAWELGQTQMCEMDRASNHWWVDCLDCNQNLDGGGSKEKNSTLLDWRHAWTSSTSSHFTSHEEGEVWRHHFLSLFPWPRWLVFSSRRQTQEDQGCGESPFEKLSGFMDSRTEVCDWVHFSRLCSVIQLMANKPIKCGIKIWCLVFFLCEHLSPQLWNLLWQDRWSWIWHERLSFLLQKPF